MMNRRWALEAALVLVDNEISGWEERTRLPRTVREMFGYGELTEIEEDIEGWKGVQRVLKQMLEEMDDE